MSSPFAFKFLGKKPFTKKTVNPEAGGKDYEAMGDAARKIEQKLSAETGGVDYEARLKVQEKMSPLNGAYSSGAGGFVYKPIAGDIRNFYNKVSAGIQTGLDKKNKKVVNYEQIDTSKPIKDLAENVDKYNDFQKNTKVKSVGGNFYRVDDKGNMYSTEFDQLGKKVLDMDQLSKAFK